MKNLEQIRAAAAAKFWQANPHRDLRGDLGQSIIRTVILWIAQQGLLSALASAKDKTSEDHLSAEEQLLLEIGRFLASRDRSLLPFPLNTTDDLLRGLTAHPSILLQQATSEALAYLGYLKRLQPR
jgi:hypothetical protein